MRLTRPRLEELWKVRQCLDNVSEMQVLCMASPVHLRDLRQQVHWQWMTMKLPLKTQIVMPLIVILRRIARGLSVVDQSSCAMLLLESL